MSTLLSGLRARLLPDALASVVVFLVALPLCMGIAIASGVPPALGLVTGIVGGLVVGTLAGSPLQVSGPAAGLAVMVYELVQTFGLPTLGVVVLIGGAVQLLAGALRLGRWFRAVPPSVVHGMLAGIGVLIVAGQFHVMVDDRPRGSGLANLASIPESLWKAAMPADGSPHQAAAAVGVLTIVAILAWGRFAPARLKAVPAPLVGVLAGVAVANGLGLPIAYVQVPESLWGALNVPQAGLAQALSNPDLWVAGVGLAVIASAETLLCAVAVDRMHQGPRTDFDRELRAQGVGNLLCGAAGALPMTGVIVRSAANVEAGARTRASAVLHGAWLLALVALAPFVLQAIPVASLAAVLVFTGAKLVDQRIGGERALVALRRHGWVEVATFGATVVGIVAFNLMTGVLVGLGLALARVVERLARPRVHVHGAEAGPVVRLRGVLTFLQLPSLGQALEAVPARATVHVDARDVESIDHACLEELASWERLHRARGGTAHIDWDGLRSRGQVQTS